MDHTIHPKHCFCQVAKEDMKPWVEKKYKDNYSTVELLSFAKSEHEKEIISIVALLDVDDDSMLKMMGSVDMPDHHIIHCREEVKKMLCLYNEN